MATDEDMIHELEDIAEEVSAAGHSLFFQSSQLSEHLIQLAHRLELVTGDLEERLDFTQDSA